ncbi:hypothetical protein V2W45_133701 [Cenococcum geophilum]
MTVRATMMTVRAAIMNVRVTMMTSARSTKYSRWSREDDDNLLKWIKDGKQWDWICRQFPNRTPGAVRLRWYTKLRPKAKPN